ncbi:MAG: hypothetical protein VSS75_019520, partial [Candidatus Parabeggiatoa sp.]|nr:hypothetical protein [Candidatus Parabeggiatoa sp.]
NQFLKEIIKQKGLRKIASLWVAGMKIDWPLLYSDEGQSRISLPTYPLPGNATGYQRITAQKSLKYTPRKM